MFCIYSKNNDEVNGKPGPGGLFVKFSMDGAPYLRKVITPENIFYISRSVFCSGKDVQLFYHRQRLSESKLRDDLHGSEYVLIYKDKDGDWMLVGDVPAMEKSKNRN
ncbi:AUX/IAA8A [Pyrus ussuriensis x Pyrus communis]|uniref:Auxin-responsive protein n=1 Tax=Pyrus ussuriensis x Pyrus communis TaxID=2448454 RepID=A0A5N5GSF4_9ROSA|nr:AUX/IAA8A [Pyrus ussuriensis x Pyrus communis]